MTIVVATLALTLGTLALASIAIGWWLGRTPAPAGRHRAQRTEPRTPAPVWADTTPTPRATYYTEARPLDDSETTQSIPMAALLSDATVPLHTVRGPR